MTTIIKSSLSVGLEESVGGYNVFEKIENFLNEVPNQLYIRIAFSFKKSIVGIDISIYRFAGQQ